ncbi:MAG: ABC transporter ATP-binding protein [Deltaproteobacteria bacterium]|jgi:lipoprotein-releasing system ATP-binding protein|nr:ABC transporter ATP-binding protein [Deltaproteobacteria bacterium]
MGERKPGEKPPISRKVGPQAEAGADGSQPLLEASGVTKVFVAGGERLTILNSLDLTVERGRSMAVLGASGSGKSTLMYLLGGLDRPTGGRVLSKGRDVFSLSENELAHWRAKEIGFVFQFHYLLSDFTALENAAMPLLLSGMGREEAYGLTEPILERVGLSDRKGHRPGALSGGEQQRVAIARALVMGPEVLLADEPTGNLDNRNASMVNDLFRELVTERNLSAIVVTHNERLARMMDACMEIFEGRLRPWQGQ